MKLITKEISAKLPELYSQEKKGEDAQVIAKFFTPWSNWTWYVTEGQKEGDDFRFFGLVVGHEIELGYFMLSELTSVRGPFGLGIERDMHFRPCTLAEVRAKHP